MKKYRILLAIVGVLAVTTGCAGYKTAGVLPDASASTGETRVLQLESETEAETEGPEQMIQERTLRDGKLPSYLTGLWIDKDQAERRPVAVMISNDRAALPHYGINRASVIYEAPVEGTMNRFMAFFEDPDDLERIGSVRSCRTYYTYFAREFEAVCAHYGQSTFAEPYLDAMDHINGISGKGSGAFYRSSDRKAPHNAYTSGKKLREAMEALSIDPAYPESYRGHYQFADLEHPVRLEQGYEATYVRPGYAMNDPWFTYNPEDGLYYRYQYGGPHRGDEGQLTAKNILFQYCHWHFYAPSEYLNIDTQTGCMGFYFTNGRGIPVTWEKESEYGVTHYYDINGQEIVLNPGTTWVCILQADQMDKAEFYGEQTE